MLVDIYSYGLCLFRSDMLMTLLFGFTTFELVKIRNDC